MYSCNMHIALTSRISFRTRILYPSCEREMKSVVIVGSGITTRSQCTDILLFDIGSVGREEGGVHGRLNCDLERRSILSPAGSSIKNF